MLLFGIFQICFQYFQPATGQWYICYLHNNREEAVYPEINKELNKAVNARLQVWKGEMKDAFYTFDLDNMECHDSQGKLCFTLLCKGIIIKYEYHYTCSTFIAKSSLKPTIETKMDTSLKCVQRSYLPTNIDMLSVCSQLLLSTLCS